MKSQFSKRAFKTLTFVLCMFFAASALFAEIQNPAELDPHVSQSISRVRSSGDFFNFSKSVSLPKPLKDGFAGGNETLDIVLGGFKKQEDRWIPNFSIYICKAGSSEWQEAGTLDYSVTEGASVFTKGGLICIGGYTNGKPSKKVFCFKVEEKVVTKNLPELPYALSGCSAVIYDDKIYVIGGINHDAQTENSSNFWVLNTRQKDPKWEILQPWPGPTLFRPAVAVLNNSLYIFGGNTRPDESANFKINTAYRYEPGKDWKKLAQCPFILTGTAGASCGDSHIVLLGGPGLGKSILAYHTITDSWAVLGELADSNIPLKVRSNGTELTVYNSNGILKGKAVLRATNYGILDHIVVLAYFIGMLVIGVVVSKRKQSTNEYFLGGQKIPWWASGLSLFAVGASAVSLMGMPGKAYSSDWSYFTASLYAILILPLATMVFVPIVKRLNISTANEYLERRFGVTVRVLGSLMFAVNQITARMATLMILPAIALTACTGIPIELSIIIIGAITTIYVTVGGLEGSIWTAVAQAIIMILSIVISIVWVIVTLQSDVKSTADTVMSANKLHMFNWALKLSEPTVIVIFLSQMVSGMHLIGDQNFIQRVQCTGNEKNAKKAVITSLAVAIPFNAVLFGLGTLLFLHYKENPQMLSPALKADGVFPMFAAQNLKFGLAGLMVVGILAATMSTLSASLNSIANVGVEDIYRRFSKSVSERKCVLLGQGLSIIMGVLGTGIALILAQSKFLSIWDLAIFVAGVVTAPTIGIFTLGIFTRKTNSVGIIFGISCSLLSTLLLQRFTDFHPFVFLPVGVLSCIAAGYITSILIKTPQPDITGLTVFTLNKAVEKGLLQVAGAAK